MQAIDLEAKFYETTSRTFFIYITRPQSNAIENVDSSTIFQCGMIIISPRHVPDSFTQCNARKSKAFIYLMYYFHDFPVNLYV